MGPIIGAAILVPLAESLNAELGNYLPGIQGVVYGAAIIIIMLAAPEDCTGRSATAGSVVPCHHSRHRP